MSDMVRFIAAAACVLAWLALVIITVRRHRRKAGPAVTSDSIIVAFASQTGTAATLAQATADALTRSGRHVVLRSLAALSPEELARATQALFVVATTGEGEAPDDAGLFLRRWEHQPRDLTGLHFALLALGDRHYRQFCAFGHAFDQLLRSAGAVPAADLVEVDQGDAGALRHWQQNLRLFGAATTLPDWEPPRYALWRLADRTLLNPDSPGAPMYRIWLEPQGDMPQWRAGDVAEVYPGPAADRMAPRPPLPHRDYTLASLPNEGGIGLTVRLFRTEHGETGLGSGWLCENSAIGSDIALRIRPNPQFHAPGEETPLILVGNGTGISGLRAHLHARPTRSGHWLIYGERDPAKDRPFGAELDDWVRSGHIERLDRVFSRGDAPVRYVQHLIPLETSLIRAWLDEGAAIYVCGSTDMGNDLDAALRIALGSDQIDALIGAGRYRRDIY